MLLLSSSAGGSGKMKDRMKLSFLSDNDAFSATCCVVLCVIWCFSSASGVDGSPCLFVVMKGDDGLIRV
jgi:hypothetical protein